MGGLIFIGFYEAFVIYYSCEEGRSGMRYRKDTEVVGKGIPAWEYKISEDGAIKVTEVRIDIIRVSQHRDIAKIYLTDGTLHRLTDTASDIFELDRRKRILYFRTNDAEQNISAIRRLTVEKAEEHEQVARKYRAFAESLRLTGSCTEKA